MTKDLDLRRVAVLSGVAVLALGVAACSSSSSGSGSSGSPSTSSSTSTGGGGATGTPLKIMVTGTLSSPTASYPQTVNGAQAAATAINAKGGVAGHKIVIESCNDSFDPNKSAACVQKAISDKVSALVGGLNLFAGSALPALEKAKIPWVAPDVIFPQQLTSPMSFPIDGGVGVSAAAAGGVAVQSGGKKVNVVYTNNTAGEQVRDVVLAGVKAAGGTASKTPLTPGTTDDSSIASSILSSKPDAVTCVCNADDVARLIQAIRQAGFSGLFTTVDGSAPTADLAKLGSNAGKIDVVATQRIITDSEPALAQLKSETSSVAGSVNKDALFTQSWLGVHMIADALKTSSAVDAASLLTALNAASDLPTYGLVTKIDFATPGPVKTSPRLFNTQFIVYKWNGKAKTPVGGFVGG